MNDAVEGTDLSVERFLQRLEAQHGEAAGSYTRLRSHKEWEKLLVSIAGKIFSGRSEL